MLSLRDAQESDCRLLWEWRNEEEVRKMSFVVDPISWEEHQKWFDGKLEDPNCHIYIALDENGIPVGHVRFDVSGLNEAVIHICIAREQCKKGYGSELLIAGVEKMFSATAVHTVNAFIKLENTTSLRSFDKSGFEKAGHQNINGVMVAHFIRRKK